MAEITDPKSALIRVIEALRAAANEVLLVGGMVLLFLITDAGSAPPRQTEDIDIVADIETRARFYQWQDRLRANGFVNDRTPGAPICRWRLKELTVDFMPTNPAILGFANQWYRKALQEGAWIEFAPGVEMKMITAPYFLATKLEAFRDRGNRDFIASKDMTDILALVDGRIELIDELGATSDNLRTFIAAEFDSLLIDDDFLDALPAHLLPDEGSQARRPLIIERMRAIAALRP